MQAATNLQPAWIGAAGGSLMRSLRQPALAALRLHLVRVGLPEKWGRKSSSFSETFEQTCSAAYGQYRALRRERLEQCTVAASALAESSPSSGSS
jgi:hypothetical protein